MNLRFVGDEDQRVAGRGPGALVDRGARLVGEALEALPHAALLQARPRGLRAERLREVFQPVEDRARELVGRAGHAQALDDATRRDDALEHAEAARAALLGHVAQHEVAAQIRLVDAVLLHRLGVRHAAQRQLDLDAEHLAP
jgi:hypothetical protein